MILRITWPLIAAAITVALFLLMANLIVPQKQISISTDDNPSIQITRTERDEQVNNKKREIPTKPVFKEMPTPPPLKPPRPVSSEKTAALDPNILSSDGGMKKINPSNDRRATPLVRFPPEYPQGPQRRGQEGWVLVEFTITHNGEVADIVIVDADPKKIFNRAVLRALKRWKYQPKIVNGKAVPQYNIREIFRFEIKSS